MATLGPSPLLWLSFDKEGGIDPAAVQQLSGLVNGGQVDEILVISHGWNNDKADALHLYTRLWANTVPHLAQARAERILVAGVQWPARKYRTDFDAVALATAHDGGALSADGPSAGGDLPKAEFDQILGDFAELVGPDGAPALAAAGDAVSAGLSTSRAHALLKSGADAVSLAGEAGDRELSLDAKPILAGRADPVLAQLMLATLAMPPHLRLAKGAGSALGLGEVVTGLFNGPRAAVARLLNLLTYYEMKKRAGTIGVALADRVLSPLHADRPMGLHLAGHSFGARLVTAAVNRINPDPDMNLSSLLLLQGAFSHNAMAHVVATDVAGAFPLVVGKPQGPITITHTHNDLACTLAYALASRLARDIATAIGDADDIYGAMGANGPQKLPPADVEQDDTMGSFRPRRGKVNPVLADAFVKDANGVDAHNNVSNHECGRLLAANLTA